jgi:nitronate monooxygenase
MAFCQRYGLRIPILLAPMAGSCPVSLAVAVADAGGMGAMGALLSSPDAIANWAAEFRSRSLGPFQLNLWIAEPAHFFFTVPHADGGNLWGTLNIPHYVIGKPV